MNELLTCQVHRDPGFSRGGFIPVPRRVRAMLMCRTREEVFDDGSTLRAETRIFVTRDGKEYCRMETWIVNGQMFILGSTTTCVPDGV